MPIHGPSSYPATMSQFIQHWTHLNALVGAPVVVAGGRAVEGLVALLDGVEGKLRQVTTGAISAALRKGELDVMKEDLISWCVLFNAKARADHGDSPYMRRLVPAPPRSGGRGAFTDPVLQTLQIWADLNASMGAPVTLRRRTTLSNGSVREETLTVDDLPGLVEALQGKWDQWTRAQQAVSNVRRERDVVLKQAYDCMRDYRLRVPLELPAGHALIHSLPALNPDPARRVTAPVASGSWNTATEKADLAAVPSPDRDIARTELRCSPADPYDEKNEMLLVSIPRGRALTFSTDLGLAVAGDVARFTWVAVSAAGREGRSNVVAVGRGQGAFSA